MNRTLFAALLIVLGYIYGTTLYEPWYYMLQRFLIYVGVLKMPENAPPGTRLLGNQVQIVLVSLVFIGLGIWLFRAG